MSRPIPWPTSERTIRRRGGIPTFKGYRGFPGSICASPNHMVVHGIPGRFKLRKGDILSIDIGVVKDGWVADGACTFPVGEVSPVAAKLIEVTQESLFRAVEPMVTAGRHTVRMGDDGWAIYSQDGSLAAHFEFTIAITAEGPRILTPWHESKARAAA